MGRERLSIGGGMLMGRVHVNFASGLGRRPKKKRLRVWAMAGGRWWVGWALALRVVR